jgi:hypothetical protein
MRSRDIFVMCCYRVMPPKKRAPRTPAPKKLKAEKVDNKFKLMRSSVFEPSRVITYAGFPKTRRPYPYNRSALGASPSFNPVVQALIGQDLVYDPAGLYVRPVNLLDQMKTATEGQEQLPSRNVFEEGMAKLRKQRWLDEIASMENKSVSSVQRDLYGLDDRLSDVLRGSGSELGSQPDTPASWANSAATHDTHVTDAPPLPETRNVFREGMARLRQQRWLAEMQGEEVARAQSLDKSLSEILAGYATPPSVSRQASQQVSRRNSLAREPSAIDPPVSDYSASPQGSLVPSTLMSEGPPARLSPQMPLSRGSSMATHTTMDTASDAGHITQQMAIDATQDVLSDIQATAAATEGISDIVSRLNALRISDSIASGDYGDPFTLPMPPRAIDVVTAVEQAHMPTDVGDGTDPDILYESPEPANHPAETKKSRRKTKEELRAKHREYWAARRGELAPDTMGSSLSIRPSAG